MDTKSLFDRILNASPEELSRQRQALDKTLAPMDAYSRKISQKSHDNPNIRIKNCKCGQHGIRCSTGDAEFWIACSACALVGSKEADRETAINRWNGMNDGSR